MGSKIIALINTIYTSVDPNWKPTDNVPELVIEGLKEAIPEILMIISMLKGQSGN